MLISESMSLALVYKKKQMAIDMHVLCIYKCIHRVCIHAKNILCCTLHVTCVCISLVNPHVLHLAGISLTSLQEMAL